VDYLMLPSMAQYSIHDVELISGVKAHTLRIWEQRYDFIKPHRSDTNIRSYNDEQLKLLLNVSILIKNGIRISKIAAMSKEDLRNQVLKTVEKDQPADKLIDFLVYAMLDFDETRFEKILSDAVIKHGFENAFSAVIVPFMIRVGTLWTTGSVYPAQEHFISNLIRRKVIAATDGLYVDQNEKSRKFVLFLPEYETHEILLLFTEYLLRKNNHHVIYLGSSVPLAELELTYNKLKPDYLVTYMTISPAGMDPGKYLQMLSDTFPKAKIIASGAQMHDVQLNKGSNVTRINSEKELLNAIS
jgi:DNA-binding transcriptional MerR regulator